MAARSEIWRPTGKKCTNIYDTVPSHKNLLRNFARQNAVTVVTCRQCNNQPVRERRNKRGGSAMREVLAAAMQQRMTRQQHWMVAKAMGNGDGDNRCRSTAKITISQTTIFLVDKASGLLQPLTLYHTKPQPYTLFPFLWWNPIWNTSARPMLVTW
jgi:hypothetical protein